MVRSHRVRVGRIVGGVALLVAATALGAPAAQAAGSTSSPAPAAAQLTPPVPGQVGGSAGLYAVAGGLVVVAGGAATWLRRKRSGRVTVH